MKCRAKVPDQSGFRFYQCSYQAVTEHGYCRLHDPDCQLERKRKRGPTRFEHEVATAQKQHAHTEELENKVVALKKQNKKLYAALTDLRLAVNSNLDSAQLHFAGLNPLLIEVKQLLEKKQ